MRSILLLIMALFLGACNSTVLKDTPQPDVSPVAQETISKEGISTEAIGSSLPITHQDTDENDLKIIDESSILGHYILKRGMFRNQEISEGYLVIEEIDVNNYGYYYVTNVQGFSSEIHTGIFYKKGGKFVQKVIEDNTEAEILRGANKSKMSIIDNIELIQKDELLKLFINSDKQEKLIWKRDTDDIQLSPELQKTLEEAKEEYRLYYKDKCKESKHFCGDGEYTKVNE